MAKDRFKVVITDCDHGFIDPEKTVMGEIDADLILGQYKTRERLIAGCKDADGLIIQYAPLTREVQEQLPHCKVMSRYGVGVDTIDLEAASDLGIIVANVPDYCMDEVSDHAVSFLFGFFRKVFTTNSAVKSGTWDFRVTDPLYEAGSSTIGILGLGRIGKAFARKMLAMGFRIIAHDPYLEERVEGVQMVDFETLLTESDFLSIHCPLDQSTYHYLGEEEFRKMKKTSVLINTARGPIVDEAALTGALQRGEIAGAALDVMEKEPPDPKSPLLRMDNVIMTPHAAWFSVRSRIELKRRTALNVALVLQGVAPKDIVNAEVLAKTRAKVR